jgi:hypothetical protein
MGGGLEAEGAADEDPPDSTGVELLTPIAEADEVVARAAVPSIELLDKGRSPPVAAGPTE